ncbi:hypothetical protein AJ79_05659 [Helicocarpus griseus UAMH5409]|uniref:Gamma-glutamylcyclotransferase AIG2-like domain-containing protein n=1 Tax=Helicocarpus griseus UAMH5409 TaxID=1447875 RepID=A0A2B7XLD2_9EURO|nr:hypothetical protein AJ79_05659 [Helicocarpus griseus UAMH5409]
MPEEAKNSSSSESGKSDLPKPNPASPTRELPIRPRVCYAPIGWYSGNWLAQSTEANPSSSGTTRPEHSTHPDPLPIRSVCDAPTGWYSVDWQDTRPKTGWYFFYGTLTNESNLATAIGVARPLALRRAKVVGYKLMLYGAHPALTDGPTTAEVRGMAFHVSLPSHARRLRGYATESFAAEACRIHFEDGEKEVVDGFTFMWDGKSSDLRPVPGKSDGGSS